MQHPAIPLLQLFRVLRTVEGRKRLQKTVHILQALGVAPFQEKFEYSHFGMYSAQLRREVERLAAEELITESSSSNAGATTYTIEKTSYLDELLQDLTIPEPEWAPIAQNLSRLKTSVLEGVSTLLFIENRVPGKIQSREKLLLLKPHLADVVDECFRKLEELRPSPPRVE